MKQTILLLLNLLLFTSCGLLNNDDYTSEIEDCEAYIEDYIVNFYQNCKQAVFYRETGGLSIIADTFFVEIKENPNVIIVNDVRYVKEH